MGLPEKTRVLIVGAGPTGLTAAALLARRGIESVVVERREALQRAPAAHVLRRRSMRVFRELGIEDEIHRRMPRVPIHFITWCSTLGGVEAGRLDFRTPDGSGLEDGIWTNCPQNVLEPILHEHVAGLRHSQIVMGAECRELVPSSDEVTARVHLSDGSETTIRADWVVACDGAGSSVRRGLGIEMAGQGALGNFFMIHFEADLRPWIEDRPGPLFWILRPESPGTLIVHDPKTSHVFMSPVTGVENEEEGLEDRLKGALGVSVPTRVLDLKTWAPHVQIAERYRQGRVFLAGDAAHRFPPTGGLGLNTGILDVENLVPKLAQVDQGAAGPELLDRYQDECRPAAEQNANDSFENLLRLGEIWRVIGECSDLAALERRLQTMTNDEQAALADAIEAQRSHFVSDGHFPEEFGASSASAALADVGR